jgi:DNA modification methylase/predicted nucleic acid-binding protein
MEMGYQSAVHSNPKTPKVSTQLAVVYRSPADLKPHIRNARTHTKGQIRQIAQSIKSFGFTNPVLLHGLDTIVAGHGRVAAANLLGIDQVPTIQLEGLTEDQIRAYVIADNRIAEKAGWDDGILAIELQHLLTIDSDFDVTVTGFEIPEIDQLLLSADAGKPDRDCDDSFENADIGIPSTKTGDLWQLGKHRILCGNALEAASYSTLLDTKRASLVFVDPPYNVAIDGNVGNIGGKSSASYREFRMASGEMSEFEFASFLTSSLKLLSRYSTRGSVHFVCMDWRHMGELLSAGNQAYDSLLNVCVWVKNVGGMGSLYRSRHEMIFAFRNGEERHRNNVQLGKFGRNRTNVWEYKSANSTSKSDEEGNLLALHPTVKPVALVADALLDCSARGDIVLDVFLGSGSTLIAAERTGRICYGMELDPLYVDTAIRRWQRLTGDYAIHAATGKRFGELIEPSQEAVNG